VPRKPRIEIPGFYHVLNRGVERRVVFGEPQDFEKFEKLLEELSRSFGVRVHNFCLMSNHYHLLLSIDKPVLSKFMRQLNASYAIYFNKKYDRSGHLWQGRFKSWFVSDEAYLYALMLYIEQNPVRAGIVETPERYPYSSARYFVGDEKLPDYLKDAWLAQRFVYRENELREMLAVRVSQEALGGLQRASALVTAPKEEKGPDPKLLERIRLAEDKKERNARIAEAYEAGHSQHKIAEVAGISQPAVHGIVKRYNK